MYTGLHIFPIGRLQKKKSNNNKNIIKHSEVTMATIYDQRYRQGMAIIFSKFMGDSNYI
jgi:hypothetical protein